VPPTRLLLIRHAEVEARFHKVFGGRLDIALSPRGQAQAVALSDWLRRVPPDAIYASPMKRVQQTLAPLLNGGAPVPVILPALREVDFGDWTGLGWEAVNDRFGVNASEWLDHLDRGAIPNAESGSACRARVEPCLRDILSRHPGQRIALFCHGGVIRMILSLLLDLPLARMSAYEIEYASVTEVELRSRRAVIQLLNFTPWRDGNQ